MTYPFSSLIIESIICILMDGILEYYYNDQIYEE